MNSRKFIIRETILLFLGELLCAGAVMGLATLLGWLDHTVVLGALAGAVLATANFFFQAIASDAAADKAVAQDVKGGKAIIQISFFGRMIGIVALLAVFAISGHFNILAMAIPLFLGFPVLMVIEFFRKSGGSKS